MDEDFIKATHALIKATERARKAGVGLSHADQESFMRAQTGGKYGLADAQKFVYSIDTGINPRNVGRSMFQGATMNFGDEIVGEVPDTHGGLRGALEGASAETSGGPLAQLIGAVSGFYGGGDKAKESMRTREGLYAAQHPVANAVGGAVGALGAAAVAAPVVGGAELASTVPRALRTGAIVGGTVGGLSGAGAGESAGERAINGVIGAGLGAGTGAVAPAVGASFNMVRSPMVRAERRLTNAVRKSGGVEKLRGSLANYVRQGQGDVVTLADLSPELQGADALGFAANNSGDVHVAGKKMLYDRRNGMSSRLLNRVKSMVGEPYADNLNATILANRDRSADAAYAALREQNPTLKFTDFSDILYDEGVAPLWAKAKHSTRLNPEPDKGISFARLDLLKRKLDGAITRALEGHEKDEAGALIHMRDELESRLTARVSGYAKARAAFARSSKLADAVTRGQDAWRAPDARMLPDEVASMSKDELDYFRKGMISELIKDLHNTDIDRDAANDIVFGSLADKAKLRAAFGDEEVFASYFNAAKGEESMHQSIRAFGGSPTHLRDAAAESVPIAKAAESPIASGERALADPRGVVTRGVDWLLGHGSRTVGRRTANRLGPMLLTQGAAPIDALLTDFQRRAPEVIGKGGYQTTPAIIASLFDDFQK